MQGRNWILVGAAILFGLIAVVFANSYFSGVETRTQRVADQQRMVSIVVASRPLEFGSKLAVENVRMQAWPANSVPEGAFRSIVDALRDNRVALRPMVAGEPVLASKVSGTDGRATLAAILPAGMRAVSIPINPVSGVSGFALPGTMVDVILTRKIPGDGATNEDMRSDVILENVPVLAVDQSADDKNGEPKVAKTATVQVTLADAQRLAIADKIGDLSLALRNVANQDEPVELAGRLGTATNRDLGGARFFIPQRASRQAMQSVSLPPAFAPQTIPALGAVPMRPSGPVMTVYRGVEAKEESVSKLGGY